MDTTDLVKLTSRAWTIPILASLYNGVPGRQAALLTATGAGRTAFGQSLAHLLEIDLMERNPGYGHPLRPEFRLTATGQIAAKLAAAVDPLPAPDEKPLLRRSWTMPVLATLNHSSQFVQIRRHLPRITDRALSQSLVTLERQAWVRRDVDRLARPPRPHYVPISVGAQIARVVGEVIGG